MSEKIVEISEDSLLWIDERYNRLREENKRLNNIINELEKELKDRIKNVPETMSEVYEDKSILHKLQELKGSDKE